MAKVGTAALTEGFRLRASLEEVETWRAAAAEEGLSVAAWLRAQAAGSPTALEARRAHAAVGKALRDGVLWREPCEVCGAAALAHHDDYSRPLVVRWLCGAHHRQWHREHPTLMDWGQAANGKARFAAFADADIRERVVALARADRRSVPNMAGILVGAALGDEQCKRLVAEATSRLVEGALSEPELPGEETGKGEGVAPVSHTVAGRANATKVSEAFSPAGSESVPPPPPSPRSPSPSRNGDCGFDTPRGIRCKSCGEVHK